MKAIQCGFHPNENIVNFCKNESCLLPMCPICIKVHTKEHMNENTHGIYDHISEVYDEIDKSLNNVKNVLKNCHEEVQEVRTMKESRKEATKKKMQQMRAKVVETIHKFIDSLEKQINEGLMNTESVLEEDFLSIQELISETAEEAQKEKLDLSGEKTLKTMISHLSSDRTTHYEQIINEITSRIQDMNTSGLSVSKNFKITQISEVLKTIRSCYRNVFVDTLNRKSLKSIDWKQLNISKLSNKSRNSAKEQAGRKSMSDY